MNSSIVLSKLCFIPPRVDFISDNGSIISLPAIVIYRNDKIGCFVGAPFGKAIRGVD
jgi:hypothetical protein